MRPAPRLAWPDEPIVRRCLASVGALNVITVLMALYLFLPRLARLRDLPAPLRPSDRVDLRFGFLLDAASTYATAFLSGLPLALVVLGLLMSVGMRRWSPALLARLPNAKASNTFDVWPWPEHADTWFWRPLRWVAAIALGVGVISLFAAVAFFVIGVPDSDYDEVGHGPVLLGLAHLRDVLLFPAMLLALRALAVLVICAAALSFLLYCRRSNLRRRVFGVVLILSLAAAPVLALTDEPIFLDRFGLPAAPGSLQLAAYLGHKFVLAWSVILALGWFGITVIETRWTNAAKN